MYPSLTAKTQFDRRAVGILLVALLTLVRAACCLAAPGEARVLWTVDLGRGLDASPIAFPSDNPNSIVIAAGGYAVRIGGDGKKIFEIEFGPEASRGGLFDPTAADLDGDGEEEIVVGHNRGHVFAIRPGDGSVVWERRLGRPFGGWRSANLADLDGDDLPEILMPTHEGALYCLNRDGSVRWRSQVEPFRMGTPTVADVDHDGSPDIVYGTATRKLVALDAHGRLLWNKFAGPLHLGRTKPIVADLDRDGEVEVYAAGSNIGPENGLVSLAGPDGTTRWHGKTRHKAYMARTVVPLDDGARGVLIGDKANSLVAYSADGQQRWRTTVAGRGVWTAPSVADVDGDGKHEIIVAVRGKSAAGHALHLLNLGGELLQSYALPGGDGFGAPLAADVNGDGKLEVCIASRAGKVSALSFGGAASEDAVFATGWHGAFEKALGQRQPSATSRLAADVSTELQITTTSAVHFGDNRFDIGLPVALAARGSSLAVEVDVAAPGGVRDVEVMKLDAGTASISAIWRASAVGTHRLSARLIDLDSSKTLAAGVHQVAVVDLHQGIEDARRLAMANLRRIADRLRRVDGQGALALAGRTAALDMRADLLVDRVNSAANLGVDQSDELAKDVAEYFVALNRAQQWAGLIESAAAARPTGFAVWQDRNPWNNDDPRDSYPDAYEEPTSSMWAFGNETESIAVNVANLTSHGIKVRWDAGTVSGKDASMPAHKVVSLRRVVRVPSRFGETVPDLLPPLADDFTIHISPGEVEQVWINVSTADLPSGDYEIRLPIRTLDAESFHTELTVKLSVSDVRLPEKSRFAMGFWSTNQIGELSTIDNLNAHRQTVWYQLPLPGAKANAQGELIGELDWTDHDAVVTRANQIDKLFYGGIPTPAFPDDVQATDELRLVARRNYLYALVAHLETHGLGWSDFMVYPADEPGLFGSIDHYMERAIENKQLDQRLQNYANPWGAITVDDIRRMAPVTDVWQPGMETVYVLGREYVAAMRDGGKPVWMYTPPGNARVLRPLGFYRAQPWLGFRWGIEGGGWWIYHSADLWATDPNQEPGYGAVASDGRAIVDSRRWEASRDGVEDYNMLSLLRERLQTSPNRKAQTLLDEASAWVEKTAFTGMPREAAPYDLDFQRLMRYRKQIRDALEQLSSP